MTVFYVTGPFEVPFDWTGRTKAIDVHHGREFWTRDGPTDLAFCRGVYVFGIRNRGFTPIYVGKATKTFKQEALAQTKLHHYNIALRRWKKGTPILMFVVHPTQKGKTNRTAIAEIEWHLIQLAKAANPELRNTHHMGDIGWEIHGFAGGRGKLSQAAKALKRMMGTG